MDNYIQHDVLRRWEEYGHLWVRWDHLIQQWIADASQLMLDMAGLTPGARVLHLAGGSGLEALQSVEMVTKCGYVATTDLSSKMTDFSKKNLHLAGCTNAEAFVMDGDVVDIEPHCFDHVITRLGLMFFKDPRLSLSRQMNAVRNKGTVTCMIYDEPCKVPIFHIPMLELENLRMSSSCTKKFDIFKLSQPGHVESIFKELGCSRIESVSVPFMMEFESSTAALEFIKEPFGIFHKQASLLDAKEQKELWDTIHSRLVSFNTGRKCAVPVSVKIITAARET